MSVEAYDFDKISQQAWLDIQEVRAAWHQLVTAERERHEQIAKQLSRSPVVGPLVGLMLLALKDRVLATPPQLHLHADGSYYIGYRSPDRGAVVATASLHHETPYDAADQLRNHFAARTATNLPPLRMAF